MIFRLVAATFLPVLLLGLLTACSSDPPATSDSTPPAEQSDGNTGTGAVDADGNEFAAAPPLGDEEMLPLAAAGQTEKDLRTDDETEPPLWTLDPDVFVRPASGDDEDELRAAPPALNLDSPRPPAEPTEDRTGDRPDAEHEPSAAADSDNAFSAAPPVAVTDAAAPIAVEDNPVRVETTPAETPYWPRFHGPEGDNKSTDQGLLQEWPDDGPPLVWTATGIGTGYSSASMANGLIYTAGNKDGNTVISAINLDGQVQWQVENGSAWTKDYPGTRGTPTIDGDRIYHQSPIGNIVCLKAATGGEIWGLNSLEAFGGKTITWALAESLLIDGDHVICCPGGSDASMAALNKMTGETIWKAEPSGDKAGYSTPTLAEHEGLRMIFVMTAKGVIGVNADTGRLLFRHPFPTKYDVNVLKPVFHDGHLFVSGGYGTTGSQLLKINVDGEDVSVELAWESKDLDNHHGGVVLFDGNLYGAAHNFSNAKWICLNWATGELKWAERGIGKGSLTYADGMLYMMSEKSLVGLAPASPEGHEVISEFRLPPGGSGASWAHPVVCGGRLYIRHADRLFAYDIQG